MGDEHMHNQHKLHRTRRPIWLACLGILVSTCLMVSTADATSFSNALSWNLHLSLEGIDNPKFGSYPC
jgi:porin